MRSCMYCGRELEKGEMCTCSQSVAHRKQKEQASANTNEKNKEKHKKNEQKNESYTNPYRTETSYKTGYVGKESRFERTRNRYKARKAARSSQKAYTSGGGGIKAFGRYVWEFIKSPVDKVTNPGYISKATVLTIAAVQGAVLWLCVFFILRGGGIGPLKLLASAMSLYGGNGYRVLLQVLLCIVSGAIGGVVICFLYSGIFYAVSRLLMRSMTGYWDFCARLATTWIPFTVICTVGVLLSGLSPITLMIMITCGAVSVAVLTYEALRTEWLSKSPGKVMYAMMLGYFVFFTITWHLLLINF